MESCVNDGMAFLLCRNVGREISDNASGVGIKKVEFMPKHTNLVGIEKNE